MTQMVNSEGKPPAYSTITGPAPADLSKLRNLVSAAIEQESTSSTTVAIITPKDSPKAEILRRFLCQVLCVDYAIATGPTTTPIDSHHFAFLARQMKELHKVDTNDTKDPNAVERLIHDDVYEPAQELGVPADAAIQMILRYATILESNGNYNGCHSHIKQHFGNAQLKAKRALDRTTIIPAIAGRYQRCKTRKEAEGRWGTKPSDAELLALMGHVDTLPAPASSDEKWFQNVDRMTLEWWKPGWKRRWFMEPMTDRRARQKAEYAARRLQARGDGSV